MTQSILLSIPTLAHHFDRLLAHGLRAVSSMTRSHALVPTDRPGLRAALFAGLPGLHAASFMTLPDAFVHLAGQLLVARHSTTETLLAARDRPPLLMPAETPFRSLDHTWRAHWSRVAVVKHCVIADVPPDAGLIAGWPLGSTGHWRVEHLCSALALKLVERRPLAGQTVSRMTRPLALVFATAQRRRTGQWTDVVNVYATLYVAFVLPAAPLLGALFLAPRIIRSCRQILTLDHLIHLSTATFHRCRLLARRTRSQVAFTHTPMGI